MRTPRLVLLVFFSAVLAAGCSRSETPQAPVEPVRLAFIITDPTDPWTRAKLTAAADSLARFQVVPMELAAPDDERLLDVIDLLPRRSVQGLLVSASHPSIGPAVVAKAGARGLKLITVDTRLAGMDSEPLPVPFAGVSQHGVGRTLAGALLQQMAERSWPADQVGILLLRCESSPEVSERIAAAVELFNKAILPLGRMSLIASTDSNSDSLRDALASNIASILAANPSLAHWLVFSADADAVFPALSALQDAGTDSASVIAGNVVVFPSLPVFDSSTPASLVATCFVSPHRYGFAAAEHLYKWVKDSTPPPAEILSPGIIVTRDNYDQLLPAPPPSP